MNRVEIYDENRKYLFGVAYRMLGTAADAEDVVQEAFLRWTQAPEEVESPRAYMTTIVTRLCIDQLRSARARREQYVGPWLPEPLVTTEATPDDAVALADSLSMAFLVLLESLSPLERAAFLLREVFDYGYDEIAVILDRSEAACRQLVSRARDHVRSRPPRFCSSSEQRREITEQFSAACATGDMDGLLALFSKEITVWSDGGGVVSAATRPVHGPDRVARFLLGLLSKAPPTLAMTPLEINGEPGFVAAIDGRIISVLTLHVGDGCIDDIYIVRNPEKLASVLRAIGRGGGH